jgi:SulP family sulfate permease
VSYKLIILNLYKKYFHFYPKILSIFQEGYGFKNLQADTIAGLTVAVVALPLSIALAVASGATPDKGIITAIVAGFIISLFSGSRVQIGGPTGAFVIIVYDIISKHGYEGLVMATFLAGLILLLGAIFKVGVFIKYISQAVITGFTTGIAVIILFSQMGDICGFKNSLIPNELIHKVSFLFHHFIEINLMTVSLVTIFVISIVMIKKVFPKSPHFLFAIIMGVLLNQLFALGYENLFDRFGTVSFNIPSISVPTMPLDEIISLLPSAFVIALLAGIEALLSAVVADSMSGDKHHSNTELFAQGFANIGSALVTGLPATGAIARTATNIKSGGQTPISGMLHAVFVFIFAAILVSYIQLIPFFTLASILIIVAWNMSEAKEFISLLRSSSDDRLILLATFLLTIFVDLTVGISVGIILSSLMFMKRMSDVVEVHEEHKEFLKKIDMSEVPDDIRVLSFDGPLFFGTSDRIISALDRLNVSRKVIILNLQDVPFIDSTAAKKLKRFIDRLHKISIIILCTPRENVRKSLRHLKVKENIHPDNITSELSTALTIAKKRLSERNQLAHS